MAIITHELTQIAVIGMGRFGRSMVKALAQQGKEVLAIDSNQDKADAISEYATHAAIADGADEQALRSLGIGNFDAVVVCMGSNLQSSILCTLICKEMGVPFILCKAHDEKHKTVLSKIGADVVVVPEMDMAKKVAMQLCNPRLNEIMELSRDFNIAEMEIPAAWAGQTLIELDIRKKYGVIVLLIKHGADVIVTPEGGHVLHTNDNIVIGGEAEKIQKLMNKVANRG